MVDRAWRVIRRHVLLRFAVTEERLFRYRTPVIDSFPASPEK
jgi:hypothetical protein